MPGSPDWRTAIVCASGPSFSAEQAQVVTEAQAAGLARVLVVSDTWKRVPTADAMYSHDGRWWNVPLPGGTNADQVRAGFPGERWTSAQMVAQKYGLRYVRGVVMRDGLSTKPSTIHTGGNSGYAAVNLAFMFGARRIALVGFDMKWAPDGKKHWFGNHHEELDRGAAFDTWLKRFAKLATDLTANGAECVNCTLDTALDCFPRNDLKATLDAWAT